MSMCFIRTALALGLLLGGASMASAGVVGAFEVVVPGTANIFGAGRSEPVDPGGGGAGTSPIEVLLPAVQSGAWFSVSAAFGSVSCCSGIDGTFNGPEGGSSASGNTDLNSVDPISGIIHSSRTMFLTGVFIGDGTSAGATAPPRLDFSDGADNFPELSPLLNQTFFIGDGLYNHEDLRHLEAQKFFIPAGATKLVLGFADGFNFDGNPGWYGDNVGEITVVGGFVPTPGAAGLLGFGAAAVLRRRRG